VAATLLLPAVVAVVVGLCAGYLQRSLRPALATIAFTALAGTAAVAAAGAVIVLASLTLVRPPWIAERVEWCKAITSTHSLPSALGVAVVVGSAAMGASALIAARRRRNRIPAESSADLLVLPIDEPTAYALPGRPGRVVVSQGMLRRLDSDERRVLLAHERAHLEYRHHRYLWVADLSAAVLPVLMPLRDRVRFATERWADEAAAAEVGDRAMVARAICRAALLQTATPRNAMAMSGLGVPDRVEALLAENADSRRTWMSAGTAAAALVVGVAASTWQLHHMLAFASHVCQLG
jgi:hypothetical protein